MIIAFINSNVFHYYGTCINHQGVKECYVGIIYIYKTFFVVSFYFCLLLFQS